jgi:serpin B
MTPHRRRRPAAVTALILLLVSCSDSPVEPPLLDELPRTLTAPEIEVIDAANGFGFRLLSEVRSELPPAENVFLSPLSVSMALGMAANGAAGETLDGMKRTLGVEHLSRDEMNQAYRGLLDLLPALDPEVELGVANSAWARSGTPFFTPFMDRVREYFDAHVQELDFEDPSAKDVINAWVWDHTGGRIEDIVQQIEPDHILFLINATYFDGSWRTRFEEDRTAQQAFHLEDGSTVSVPMMSAAGLPGFYYMGPDVAVADLPYGGSAYSMTVVVPRQGRLSDLMGSLTEDRWAGWMRSLGADSLPVRLPRFQMEYAVQLKDPLSRMGMAVAFTDQADLSDLTPLDALITKVRHKTFLSVDERGTVAAAATSVEIGLTSAPVAFSADRPFIVAIRERLSGTILFLGAVYDPR